MLIYGTECCYLSRADLSSLDFVVVRYLMKLFRTSQAALIDEYLGYFGYKLPSSIVEKRTENFKRKYMCKSNNLCTLWATDPD